MDDLWTRFTTDLAGRLTGPMTFRLVLQPCMAMLQAWRDGRADAHAGRPPFFGSLFLKPTAVRSQMLAEAARAVLRVLVLGVIMDVAYQWLVFRWVYPLEVVTVALMLAFVPYVLFRGVANRIARRR
jgi:hypothetical protein